jgi:hypothetical protein
VIQGTATIPPDGQVMVGPGEVLKFTSADGNRGQIVANGSFVATGTSTAPATLTSGRDDTAGGHCMRQPEHHANSGRLVRAHDSR